MGTLAGSSRVITGSSISEGSFARAAATFSRTSCAAIFPSVSSLNCMTTIDSPSCDVDWMWSTPAIWLTASSTFFVTSDSTCSGPAPRRTVVTVTNGMSTSGNWSMFSLE